MADFMEAGKNEKNISSIVLILVNITFILTKFQALVTSITGKVIVAYSKNLVLR